MYETVEGPSTLLSTDWSKCAMCQKGTREKLQCPANSKQIDQGSTYTTLAENLKRFHELNALPDSFLKRLDEGGGIEETFRKQRACFHVSCRLKFNSTKLKRKAAASCSITGTTDITEVEDECPKKLTRRDSAPNCGDNDRNYCFICDETAAVKELRSASTFQLDEKVRKCALILQDSKLLSKLSAGDVISQGLKYHNVCLIALYRKAQPKLDSDEPKTDQMRHGLVFAELTEYIQEVRENVSVDRLPVFKLADLVKLYKERLQDYGTECVKVHTGRLKTRLLAHFPDLKAQNIGRDVLLTFSNDLNIKIKEHYAESFDDEAVHLAKAARIVRRDLFHMQTKFTESFDENCQHSSVPDTLLALMQMILQGPSIDTVNRGNSQASLSLAQLASFNAVKTENMGPDKAGCLPMFHNITGCDTVSSFNGVGKKKAWEAWQACKEFTETFHRISTPPFDLTGNDRAVLERFIVLIYDKTSNCIDVNSARKDLFVKKGRQINNIPPSSEALLQHFKRAVYQGGHIWSQAEDPTPILPNPSEWGWQLVFGKWQPFWTTLPQASTTCQELLKCACKKGCHGKRCKCNKAGLLCTALCKCSDDCASKVLSK